MRQQLLSYIILEEKQWREEKMKVVTSLVRKERNNVVTFLTPPWRTPTNFGKFVTKKESTAVVVGLEIY